MMKSKICTKCKKDKILEEFNKHKLGKYGRESMCSSCRKEYQKEHYQKNNRNRQEYYQTNINEIKSKRKEFRDNNKNKIKNTNKSYYDSNREELLEKQKEYYQVNKEKVRAYQTEYMRNYRKDKMLNDDLYRLKCKIRDLVKGSIRDSNFTKKSKTGIILGCSFEEFKEYIESKWEPWMNWNNYGNWNGVTSKINESWDIDHIIPMCSAKTEEGVIYLNHYTNLQPLCSYKNRYIKRGNH